MIDSTREPDLVRLLADLEGRLYAQERLTALGEASTLSGPVHITVKNTSGGALTAGTAVYATGSVGASGAVEVGVCDNTNAATMPALGLLDGDLANNGEGSATILGIIDQIDTSGWSINDELWVNGAGALTNIRPSSGLIQKIGRVVRVNASTGEILVLGAGRTNDVPFPLFVDDANQRVGIGTTSPASLLEVDGSLAATSRSGSRSDSSVTLSYNTSDSTAYIETWNSKPLRIRTYGAQYFNTSGTDRMTIKSDGKVGIGTTSPLDALTIGGNTTALLFSSPSDTNRYRIDANMTDAVDFGLSISYWDGSAYQRSLTLRDDGKVGIGTTSPSTTLDVNGSLSKNSGSFRIPHPLPELTETHHLVHSFVEAPQADNIYRGRVALVDGSAAVDLDVAAGMSAGTFVMLNRDVQAFTSNETGPCRVWSSVSDGVLTITAEHDDCAHEISWLVIGERQDQHMYDTEWTDDDGRVIVEPVRLVEPDEVEN